MTKTKKEFIVKRFSVYMGKKKILIPISLLLSGLSAVLHMVPFILIWMIIRSLLAHPQAMQFTAFSFYAWLAFASAIGSLILYFCALMSSHLAAFHVEVGMQKVGMEKILSMPLGFFETYSSGKIRKIVNDGAGTTHSFLAHQLPDLAGSVISPIMLLILLFVIDWRMGIASLIPILFGFFLMQFMTNTKGKNFQKNYYDSLEEMSAESVEYIRGIPVVKTFGQTIFSFKRFYRSIVRYKEMVIAFTLLWQKPMSLFTVVMESTAFFLVPTSIFLIGRGENLSLVLADFVFYLLISPIFTSLLMKSMHFQHNVMAAEQAIDRLDNLLNFPRMHYKETSQRIKDHSIIGKNVGFSYEGSTTKTLDTINFSIQEGETIALIGPSGGGKTTIARLIARFWDTDEGEITIGGVNVKNITKEELMNTVSFVFQTTQLMKGSLRYNLCFDRADVSDEEIHQALIDSQSLEIIEKLPDGIESIIGTQGTYLSGGEQQRIALARAMIKNAPIVLLDEATAFADPENEHLIQKALKKLSQGKTTVMIAHRLTTVQDADKILVIDKGKIVEQGNHVSLMKSKGIYKKMWDEYQSTIDWKIASEKKEGTNDSVFSK